jgi:hypothetical protein
MIEVKKDEALEVVHVYVLSTDKYTADYADGANDDGIHPYEGPCSMGIYKEDFEALKEAGFPCEEFTQVVLASSDYDNVKDCSKHTIRQCMYKHVVHVDIVHHTNF